MKTGNKYMRLRVTLVGLGFGLLLAVIVARAVNLQVCRRSRLSELAAGQYEKSYVYRGKRGSIYDDKFRNLALTLDVTSIGLHPRRVVHPRTLLRKLSRALKIDRRRLQRKFASKRPFVWLKRKASPKEVTSVRALHAKAVAFVTERNRFYPNRELAAQVLGFTGVDGKGLEGLEFFYEHVLRGSQDRYTVWRDARGRRFEMNKNWFPGDSGKNLVLTIDAGIQYITEQALAAAVEKFSAKGGMAVVMAPATGAILALANYPGFNPNTYTSFPRSRWRNRAITDPFEPGSTMKIFVAAAALESGKISANSIFFCENGAYRIGRNTIHDTHPHGWLSLQQIVKVSSNIGAAKVGSMLGARRLYRTLRDFGFSAKTGIDAPGESSGSLTPYRKWTRIDAGTITFGQGIAVTAVQLAAAASAIANGGMLMRPYLVQAITDHNGRLVRKNGPHPIRRVISAKTAATLRRIMQTVTGPGGTGVNAALADYPVGGKTGTAQKIGPGGTYAHGRYLASFIGFVPADQPEACILVVVDEPRKFHYGGTVAAPAFRKIARSVMDRLHIPPRRSMGKLNVAWVEREAR